MSLKTDVDMQGVRPVLQAHHLAKPRTEYLLSGVLGLLRVSLHNLSKSQPMISLPNISLLTGSVIKVPETAIWVVQELASRGKRESRQRCILLSVVPRSGISPLQGPLGGKIKV